MKEPPSKRPRHTLPKAFRCAFVGIWDFFHGRNSRIQSVFGLLSIAAGVYFKLERWEWIAVVLSIGGVLTAEALNSAIERAVDLASPGEHELAKQSKDLAAGAVLIASIATIVVGLIVFIPHLITLVRTWGSR